MGHFVMVAIGSSGDVNPFLGIAAALRERGHRTTIISAPQFAGAATSTGSGFAALGTWEAYGAIYGDPDLWHPRRGLRIYFSYLSRLVDQTVELIKERYEPGDTVVLSSFQCFGARVAHEALGVPLCTILPYPISLQSVYDPNRNPIGNPPKWMGRTGARLMYRVINWEIARHSRGCIEAARRKRGLGPSIGDVVAWSYSPELIVGLWPPAFSAPQPDWPRQAQTTGFVSYDGPSAKDWTPPIGLPERDDWLVFTPGSQMTHGREYFHVACEAAAQLGRPTLMVASDRAALPDELPNNVRHVSFAPFTWLFARAVAVVHHGGIGTAGRALQAGLPQLIIPRGFDQFDNAQRVERIGAGHWMKRRELTTPSMLSAVGGLLVDEAVAKRCAEVAADLASHDANRETCRAVERLLG